MSEQSTGSNPGGGGVENFFSDISFDGGSQGSNETTTTTQTQTAAPATQTQQTTAPVTEPAPAQQQTTPPVQQTQQTQQQSTTPPVQQSLSLTPEQLAAIVGAAKPLAPEPVVKEPTPEETDAHFNVIRPKEEDIATVFRGGPEGTAKMQEMLHGAAKMGATIASHHLIGELKKLHEWTQSKLGELAPARQVAESQIMDQHAKTFFTKFPHWGDSHVPILKDVYDKLLAEKFQGTPEQVYARINDEALRIARVINPQFGGTTGATGNGGNPALVPPLASGSRSTLPPSQMAQLPSGGSGNSGVATGSSNGNKTGPAALFGD